MPKKKRRKWDIKTKKGIFVGYDENTKRFRIWLKKDKLKYNKIHKSAL